MRLYAEVVSAVVDVRNIADRKSGELKPTQVMVIHAIDNDASNKMFKISIWENFQSVARDALKGAVLELIFHKIRPGNNYDPLDQITVNEENVRVVKSAAAAIKEMQENLARKMNVNKQDSATPATS